MLGTACAPRGNEVKGGGTLGFRDLSLSSSLAVWPWTSVLWAST
jgi:hypothetical protein